VKPRHLALVLLAVLAPAAPVVSGCERDPPPVTPDKVSRARGDPGAVTITRSRDPAFDDGVLDQILLTKERELVKVMMDPNGYRLQILYTEVKREGKAQRLLRHGFRVDAEYFYPASAIKPALALGALEALHDPARVGKRKVDFYTPLRVRDMGPPQKIEENDSSETLSGKISIGHEIKKMLLVSDNQSYNRLYNFLGQKDANQRMWRLGLASVRLRHRLVTTSPNEDGAYTPPTEFLGDPPLTVPEQRSDLTWDPIEVPGAQVGTAHVGPLGYRVNEPMSFAEKNRISLVDLQDLLIKIVRPDLGGGTLPQIDSKDKDFLANALGTLPSLSKNPSFEGGAALDELHKPLLAGINRVLPASKVFVFSKAGRAYGFSIDNAYVLDPKGRRSFFLSAVMFTDSGTVGDDKYPYNEVAVPFFAHLGEAVTRHAFEMDGRKR
jgi:hypothetical protein